MSEVARSMGTKLYRVVEGDDDILVAGLTSIGEVGRESEEIDTTTLDSPNDYREFVAGVKDAGEISITGLVKGEVSFGDLDELAESRDVVGWKVESIDGATWEFDAFVKLFRETESTVESVRGFTGTLRVSGAPEYTAPTPPSA